MSLQPSELRALRHFGGPCTALVHLTDAALEALYTHWRTYVTAESERDSIGAFRNWAAVEGVANKCAHPMAQRRSAPPGRDWCGQCGAFQEDKFGASASERKGGAR
jgi:hypothetical protein